MSDIQTGITLLTGAITIAKGLLNTKKQMDDPTYKLQIIDLVDKVLDAKTGMSEQNDLIREKNDEIRTLKEKLKVKAKMVYNDPYYQMENNKAKLEGQYCKVCYDGEGLLMRLESLSSNSWKCGKCNNICYKDDEPTDYTTIEYL